MATNTGGTSTPDTQGVGTIRDDGQGSIYLGNNNTATPNQPGDVDPGGPDYPAQLDDDRVLTVNNVEVNEGSPYAVFTVTGANGQTVKLSLDGASGNGTPDAAGGAAALGANPALQYYEAGVWKTYDANDPPKITDGTTLLVRVAINAEQETALDGPETFRLVATNTGNTSSLSTEGVATIKDDGTGSYWIGNATTPATTQQLADAGVRLDDDRTVTVNSFNINEGSPYAVFTVSATNGAAQAGQLVTLSLSNVSTTGMAGLEVYTGSAWVAYTGGTVALDSAGKLLVRTAMTPEQDVAVDNGETFTLTVTNTGGAAVVGTATVKDDGTGDYFAANNNTGAPVLPADKVLDDDRPLTITNVTVSEAAGPAAFEITGAANQWVKLELQTTGTGMGHAIIGTDITSSFTFTKWNSTSSTWEAYTPTVVNGYIQMPSDGSKIQVLVPVTRDALVEGNETFYLAASNTGGSVVRGTGTILDYAPAPVALTATAVEAGGATNGLGGTGGSNPSNTTSGLMGGTGLDLYSVALGTSAPVLATVGTLTGSFGTLTFATNGTWTYTVNNLNEQVQALRLSSDKLTETFTYTVADSIDGAKASNTLTITITGANDAPVAIPDYNTAKESTTEGLVGGAAAYDPMNALNTVGDRLGYKAVGNVLPNDTDVDAGDGKSLLRLTMTATASTVSSTVLNFTAPNSNVSSGYYVFFEGKALKDSSGRQIQVAPGFTKGTSPVPLTGTIDLAISQITTDYNSSGAVEITDLYNRTITFASKADGSGSTGSATLTGSTETSGASNSVVLATPTAGIVSGMQVKQGSTVLGNVTGVVYDSTGKATSITLSTSVSLTNATLTFSGALNTNLVGKYGTLRFDAEVAGAYTYTPFANISDLSEGEWADEVFTYVMQDTAGLTSESTLTIRVYGSGQNDPNAVPDTNSINELRDSTASNVTASNVLSNDTTQAGTNTVWGVRTSSESEFTSVSSRPSIDGLYGTLTISSNGAYTYTLNDANAQVQALNNGQTLTEQFQYEVRNGQAVVGSDPAVYLKDVATLTITINGTNDTPVLDLNTSVPGASNYATTFTEGGAAVPLLNSAGTNLSDVDNTTFRKVSVSFAATNFGNANEILSIAGATGPNASIQLNGITTTPGTFVLNGVTYDYTVTISSGTVTLAFTGDNNDPLSTAQAEALLDALRYSNSSENSTGGSSRVFTLRVTDSGDPELTSNAVTSTITVVPVNDPPTLDLDASAGGTGYTGTFKVGSTASPIADTDSLIADVDSANVASATIVLTNAKPGDVLSVLGTLPTGITASEPDSADGKITLTLTGSASLAAYQDAIEAIRFSTTGSDYTTREIQVTVNDVALASNTAIATLAVQPDDRLPTVTGTTVNEASPYVLFTLGGASGQRVTLDLLSGTASLGLDTSNAGTNVPLQYLVGSTWTDYTPGSVITLSGTSLLVRTAVVNDSLYEGMETLQLVARNDAGVGVTGTSTIKDDGTGSYFAADNNTATSNVPAGVRLDDDRPLTVNTITVNEGSPYATFTVTGATDQTVLLSLANAAGDPAADATGGIAALGTSLPTVQYYNGTSWVNYNPNNPPTITSGTTLLVRVPVNAEQDTALDGPETFNLVATNTGGTSGTGQATIKDDGTGSYFAYADNNTSTPLTAPAASQLDDDRPLTVNSITVNEASPYATFTVTGVAGQWVSLALGNTTATNDVDATLNTDTGNAGTSVPLQYFNGTAWVDYTPSSRVQIPAGSTTLLVRTAIVNDAGFEGPETFTLTATNTGGTGATGTATIKDDGTGDIFKYSTTSPGTLLTPSDVGYPVLDDDRVLTVSNVTVNEGSPYAVFTVTGANGQIVKLSLDGASGNGTPDADGGAAALGTNPALQYYEAGVWKTYDANNPPKISDGTTLLVRVAINAEQETDLDGPETFRLVATNTGGTASAANQGVATIRDDGQGDYWIGDASVKATAAELTAAKIFLDDDRITPVTISSPTVNEASPYAVFTVSGALNQLVSLNLAPGDAGANVDFVSKLEYSPDGTTWLPYTGGNVALTGTGGTLLVRVPIINDDTLEPDENFTLTATNTGGTPATGTATITDDGNGAYWFGNSATPATAQQLTDAGKVLDDDRPLTIAPVTVNEASPFAVFTVTGSAGANPADQAGQLVKLNLNNVTTTGLSGLQYYDPATAKWEPYTPNSYVPLDSAGKLLVRVAINPEQESLQDGPETFNLVATNTGGSSTTGLGTVVDDGTGSYFAANNNSATSAVPANVRLDDDRPLTVGNITVNEGSPVAVFTVTGAPGQVALLSLGNAAAASPAGDAIGGTAALGTTLPTLQYYNPAGSGSWVNYDANNPPVLTAAGNLLVRVSITPESDGVFDGPETFQLRATNTGNSTGVGTATILDDGTGSYWIADAVVPATPAQLETATIKLDDDRPITVKGGTYNEGSPRAVFTVTANAGQLLTLGVEDGQTTGLVSAPLSYSVDGGATWLPYTGAFVAGPVPVLVAVNITSERDEVYEVSEEFKLVVNPGQPTRAAASGFIVDDGTGAMYDAGGAAMPESAVRDDDRPRLQVTGPASPVSEGSPAVFTVTLSKTLLSSTPIDLALNPGTASAGDFAMGGVFYLDSNGNEVPLGPVGGPYAIPAGVSTFFVRALTTQDSNYEGLESLRLVATLPANVGGDSQGADAGIIDDGSGVVYTGKIDPQAGLLVDAAATPDDDRPVAAMVDPAPAPAPAVVPPALPPSAPSLHVQFAVADARAATSGAASVASGGVMPVSPAAAGLVMQALDAQFEKFERPTDPHLFVLPAVNAARGQASEAQVPSVMQQSGLLWNELMSDGIGAGVVFVSQRGDSLTLADAELTRLMDEPTQQAALEANADDTAQESERQKAHLRAARLALAQSQQDAGEPVRGHTAFSRQLQQAGKRPVWMARSSRA